MHETLTNVDAPSERSKFEEINLDQFVKRMKLLIKHFGSAAEIARKCGFSEAVVRSWRNGASDPSRARCVMLAQGTGASLLWIVAGEGPMWPDKPAAETDLDVVAEPQTALHSHSQPLRPASPTLDPELLGKAYEMVEQALSKRGIRHLVNSADFGTLARIVYDDLAQGRAEDVASAGLASILNIARSSSS